MYRVSKIGVYQEEGFSRDSDVAIIISVSLLSEVVIVRLCAAN